MPESSSSASIASPSSFSSSGASGSRFGRERGGGIAETAPIHAPCKDWNQRGMCPLTALRPYCICLWGTVLRSGVSFIHRTVLRIVFPRWLPPGIAVVVITMAPVVSSSVLMPSISFAGTTMVIVVVPSIVSTVGMGVSCCGVSIGLPGQGIDEYLAHSYGADFVTCWSACDRGRRCDRIRLVRRLLDICLCLCPPFPSCVRVSDGLGEMT